MQLLEISFNCLEEAESNIPVSPLHLAVSMRRIINKNKTLKNVTLTVLMCILLRQAYHGHCEALSLLCETLVSLDVRDIEGQTALHLASQRGFSQCVEVLLKHHASYTLKDYKRKWTALHAAGLCGSLDILYIFCLHVYFWTSDLFAVNLCH